MGMMMGMQAAMQGNEESDATPASKSEDKHVSWSPRSFRMVVATHQIFLEFSPTDSWGSMTQFDGCIFFSNGLGKNHQLVFALARLF